MNVILADKGMTKADVAKNLGISPQGFQRKLDLESINFVFAENLAKAMGVSVSELYEKLGKE